MTRDLEWHENKALRRMEVAAPKMHKAGTELAAAASEIHPTAPSRKSMERLHGAIYAWDEAAAEATGEP
jgi:hypothetical protein